MHKFWSLESWSQTSSLGLRVFDKVSVSYSNFNQVSVSKVTVSTTSLMISFSIIYESPALKAQAASDIQS